MPGSRSYPRLTHPRPWGRAAAFAALAAGLTLATPAIAAQAHTTSTYAYSTLRAENVGVLSSTGTHVGGTGFVSATHPSIYFHIATVNATNGAILFSASTNRGGTASFTHGAQSNTKSRCSWSWEGLGSASPLRVTCTRYIA
ncbi:MAG: hypothetical protein ABI566_14150 [Pseudolysinimonas sp.]